MTALIQNRKDCFYTRFQIFQNGKQNVQQSTSKLDMKNLSGLFTVIFIGVVTSFIFLIAEYSFACFEDVYGNVYGNDVSDQINVS